VDLCIYLPVDLSTSSNEQGKLGFQIDHLRSQNRLEHRHCIWQKGLLLDMMFLRADVIPSVRELMHSLSLYHKKFAASKTPFTGTVQKIRKHTGSRGTT
jgi:hypothetical protein